MFKLAVENEKRTQEPQSSSESNSSASFKVKVAIEAIKEQQNIQELAAKYELHPTHINT